MRTIAGIPAYNKQYPVCGVIHAAEDYVNEIIVVDDGSVDQTPKLAKRAGAVVLRHETNIFSGESRVKEDRSAKQTF
jgi:glycosyltransferase involved in cell wall biosynthesis